MGMSVLFCTDGGRAARAAVDFGGRIARACDATATVLGVVERPPGREAIEAATREAREALGRLGVPAEVVVSDGQPLDEIAREAGRIPADLVVLGSERRGASSGFPVSPLAYRVLKSSAPPVLVVPTDPGPLRRVLICSSGASAFEKALALPARIAARTGAEPTLLHVLPRAPGMYGDLGPPEEGRDWLRSESSKLTGTLDRQLELLEREVGSTSVAVRHGLVTEEILDEVDRGDYDLVVTGSVPADTSWPTYVMGNVTRELVDRADVPVLVVRTPGVSAGLGALVRRLVGQLFPDRPTA